MTVETARVTVTGMPVGTVIEGSPDNPQGRRVDHRPAAGGRSLSHITEDGNFQADLSGPLMIGRPAEPAVMKTLIQALRDAGRTVDMLGGAKDEHGQDAILRLDDTQCDVQIVSLPSDSALWRDLRIQGSASRAGDESSSLQIVREALVHKATSARGTLLVLDASHVGAIINPRLVEAYRARYGNPVIEFHFAEVWIVGPTATSTKRLG